MSSGTCLEVSISAPSAFVYPLIARGELLARRAHGSIRLDPNHVIEWTGCTEVNAQRPCHFDSFLRDILISKLLRGSVSPRRKVRFDEGALEGLRLGEMATRALGGGANHPPDAESSSDASGLGKCAGICSFVQPIAPDSEQP
jgi:hypothetical protein